MKKIFFIIPAVVLILSGCTLGTEIESNEDKNQAMPNQEELMKNDDMMKQDDGMMMNESYTMDEVAEANSAEKCWSVIRGEVYDLTNWIGNHPGGEQAILGLCGVDGTSAFENQHGGMPQQEAALESFKIGTLSQ